MAVQKLSQVSGKTISAVSAKILELRSPVAGTLQKVTVFVRENVSATCTFDVNKGTVGSGLTTIFGSPSDRPSITSGNYSDDASGLAVAVAVGDILSVDADVVGSSFELATVVFEIEDGVSSGSLAQDTETVTTASLNNTQIGNVAPTLGKQSIITRIVADRACWVRLYATAQNRTDDAARMITEDPTGEHGVLLDCLLESSNLTLDLAPACVVFDGETSRTGNIAAAIQNLSGSTSTVQVIFTKLTLES